MRHADNSCILGFHMLFYILCALLFINAITAEATSCEDDKELPLMCERILRENLCNNATTGFDEFSQKHCRKTCQLCS
ncbi:hypothetical protein GCK32_022190 [Trichostrongylus colubriformis]|uniref:ShKT domain-containing protein n=1 Tax=Trichostrongylus colubriformis TaxID=6319 RepID=A0AAN8IRE2_TRICO